MSKIISSFIIICVVSLTTFSQSSPRPRFFCGYGEGNHGSELCSKISAMSFSSDQDAEKTVERVLTPLGLSRNFVLLPCDYIDNAAAVTYDDGIRYIIYNRAFMIRISNLSSDWASLGIVAHEIGHHLQGHTTRRMSFPPSREELRQSRMQELEADEFSGFIMYKLGASLAQAQSAMSSIAEVRDEELSTHPKRLRRTEAIEKGFKKAEAQNSLGVIEKRPSAEEFYLNGNDAFEHKNYYRAIDFFSAAIAINPNYSAAYFRRAYVKSDGLNDCKGAIEDYTTASRLRPDDYAAPYNRGVCRSALKDNTGAIEDYTTAIRLKPNYWDAYMGRGNSRFALKEYTEAIGDHTIAIRLKPDYWAAYHNRGNNRFELKDYTGAIEDYTTAIRGKSDYWEAYVGRGGTRFALKEYTAAIEDYTTAIRLKPDYWGIYNNRGNSRLELKQYTGAIEDYTNAIRLNPGESYLYENRGIAREKFGDSTGACDDYRKSCSLGNRSCAALNSCKP